MKCEVDHIKTWCCSTEQGSYCRSRIATTSRTKTLKGPKEEVLGASSRMRIYQSSNGYQMAGTHRIRLYQTCTSFVSSPTRPFMICNIWPQAHLTTIYNPRPFALFFFLQTQLPESALSSSFTTTKRLLQPQPSPVQSSIHPLALTHSNFRVSISAQNITSSQLLNHIRASFPRRHLLLFSLIELPKRVSARQGSPDLRSDSLKCILV